MFLTNFLRSFSSMLPLWTSYRHILMLWSFCFQFRRYSYRENLLTCRSPLSFDFMTSFDNLCVIFHTLKPSKLTVIANLSTIDFWDRNVLHPSPYRVFQWLFQLNSGLRRQMEKWSDKLAVSPCKGGKLPIILYKLTINETVYQSHAVRSFLCWTSFC